MVKKIKYNEDEAKTLSLELEAEVLKLKTALGKLEANIGMVLMLMMLVKHWLDI